MPIPIDTPGLPLSGSNTTAMLKWLCFTALPALFANQIALAAGLDSINAKCDTVVAIQRGQGE